MSRSQQSFVVAGVGCLAVATLMGMFIEMRALRRSVRSLKRAQDRDRLGAQQRFVTVRILPGQDLANEIEAVVMRLKCRAATVISCVGSLKAATLRLANASVPGSCNEVKSRVEKFEIVSLAGTLEFNPALASRPLGFVTRHLHLALADKDGVTWGGHVISNSDTPLVKPLLPVFTTAEVCLLLQPDVVFSRRHCDLSGWPELHVTTCKPAAPVG